MKSVRRPVAPVPPALRNAGIAEFSAEDDWAYGRLQDAMRFAHMADDNEKKTDQPNTVAVPYENERELLAFLHQLQAALQPEEAGRVRVAMHYDREGSPAVEEAVELSSLFASVGGHSLSEYILHHYFTTYLQPIVQADRQVIGYECLLRPLPEQEPFRPAEMFALAQQSRHHAFLDQAARHAAIRISAAHLAPGIKRFINFLPSSVYCTDSCLQGAFDVMAETATRPEDVVFEVVETEPLNLPELADIFDYYRSRGVKIAVDDVGSGYATVAVLDQLKPDYVKLDRRWVSNCEQDRIKQQHIADVLERAARFGGIVLAEGVEREEEWHYLRRAGVPLMQGYLFGRAVPVPERSLVTAD